MDIFNHLNVWKKGTKSNLSEYETFDTSLLNTYVTHIRVKLTFKKNTSFYLLPLFIDKHRLFYIFHSVKQQTNSFSKSSIIGL